MATTQTDIELLTGILERFDPATVKRAAGDFLDESGTEDEDTFEALTEATEAAAIESAIADLIEGVRPRKYVRDLPDPGEEVPPGTDNVVPRQEVDFLERVIYENNLLPVHFLDEGAVMQKAVARVTLKEAHGGLPAGSGYGTGFLVSPSLFMTNNHVIKTAAFARKVDMQFNYQLDYNGTAQTVDAFSTNPDDLFYTNVALDFTLIRLNRKSLFQTMPFAWQVRALDNLPPGMAIPDADRPRSRVNTTDWWRRWTIEPGARWGYLQLTDTVSYAGPDGDLPGTHLNIVQHPSGRRKEVALQRNNITNIYKKAIRYTTDTEPGSSGSPVFNNAWELLAIHHAAGDRDPITNLWRSNEGMRMDKIVAKLRSHFSGSTDGQEILTELGI